MNRFSEEAAGRRGRNSRALAAFDAFSNDANDGGVYRTVRSGKDREIYTIGYERRDGEDLISALIDAGVDTLVDVREKAMSRKPDFRGKALEGLCEDAGIRYVPMPSLGSTGELREQLRETGDFGRFRKRFTSLANRRMKEPLGMLADLSKQRSIALLCYERCHEECHRSIIADLVAESTNATIVAIG